LIEQITPLILTFNEAQNLERTLSRLTWASRIVVLDSFSTDATETICRKFPQVEFLQRGFDSFAGQCNFGLSKIQTPWVLSLDADYVLTEEVVGEIHALREPSDVDGYSAGFVYCVHGHPLRASLYPPRTVLYRPQKARYRDEGHGHRVAIEGVVRQLSGKILHDDRKPLERWFSEQLKYSAKEAALLTSTPNSELNRADRVRKTILLGPPLVLAYTLLAKGLILDGWPGWYYAGQRLLAELLLSLRLIETRLKLNSEGKR
jgi:glycosyltransferase involved in cell wall biosynthesis